MKILVVSQYYYPEQFRVNEICEALVRRGHQVTVLTGLPNYPEGDIYPGYETKFEEIHNGVRILRCRIQPRKKGTVRLAINYASYMFSADRAVRKLERDYDVVFIYQLSPVSMVVPALTYKKLTGAPVYLYCLDLFPDSIRDVFPSTESPIFQAVRRWCVHLYNGADIVGITSRPFREYLHEVCELPVGRIHYLPQHAEDMSAAGDLDTEDNGCADIVFMGNVGPAQDLENVVRAVSLVKTDKPFRIHIVGIGASLDSLKQQVQQLGVEDRFVFHGRHPITEMPRFYRLADACLLTLYAENAAGMTIPGKLQGYMSAGKPVIAAINGAAAEVIQASGCGIRVPASQPEALARALTDFIEDPEAYRQMGEMGRQYYDAHFSLDTYVTALEQQLRGLCG